MQGHPRHLVLPHLGACTREAEDKSAAMAAATVREFLESGNVRHSVNFPPASLKRKPFHDGPRLCIVVQNEPGASCEVRGVLAESGSLGMGSDFRSDVSPVLSCPATVARGCMHHRAE